MPYVIMYDSNGDGTLNRKHLLLSKSWVIQQKVMPCNLNQLNFTKGLLLVQLFLPQWLYIVLSIAIHLMLFQVEVSGEQFYYQTQKQC